MKKSETTKAKAPAKAAPKTTTKAEPKAAPALKSAKGHFLVVVESPTKQKTITKMLGHEFTVKSSFGHVRDLPERDLGVDEKNDFKPTYVVIPKAVKNIEDIKRAAKSSDLIYLATDPDREGESIAWHLVQLLNPEPAKVRRIAFHEITKQAITHALESARQLDMSLVEAQQARRVLDRLVGYKLSPLLWRKVGKGLSAGRVQSVAVRIVVERAREIAEFKPVEYYSAAVELEKPGFPPRFTARIWQWQGAPVETTTTFKYFAEDYKVRTTCFRGEADLAPAIEAIKAGPLTVTKVDAKETRQRPKPPFITSTLQQDAYNKLGFNSQKTMMLAQELYEGVPLQGETVGLITYMRTDSFNVSTEIQAEARKFIASEYGDKFMPPSSPSYVTKVKGAQEAHEAIRPSSVFRKPSEMKKYLSSDQARLYELVWLRFMASQMADAVFDTVSIEIAAGKPEAPACLLRAGGRTVKFDGYLQVYKEEPDTDSQEDDKDEEAAVLPALAQGDNLALTGVTPKGHTSSPPPQYNEASLIKTLEKHGIGRPSTYAPIIKTIIDRKYVLRQAKTSKLGPTELGVTVTEKLKGFFKEIMELGYTADVEEKLDEVAEGNIKWVSVIKDFYGAFQKDLNTAYDGMAVTQPKQSDEKCPKCGEPMLIRESRFGKYLSCSKFPKCDGKIRLDSEGKKIVPEVTDKVCELCGKPMLIRSGWRGKFLACSGFPKCKNTKSIEGEGAPRFSPIKTDRKCDKCGSAMLVRQGRNGYFLACSGYPKCKNIADATQEELKEIVDAAQKAAPPAPATEAKPEEKKD